MFLQEPDDIKRKAYKASLAARIEAVDEACTLNTNDPEEFLTDAGTHQKQLTCKSCGKGFHGRAGAGACSPACKKRLQRAKKK